MPTGPFGFPRVTNIGPFVDEDASQEFNREIEKKSVRRLGGTSNQITAIHGIRGEVQQVVAKLVVRRDINPEEGDGILSTIEKSIAPKEKTVGRMSYWMAPDRGIASIIYIEVDGDFQQMGIGTKLKEMEMDHMRDNGIDLVYTEIISDSGYALAKKTGFKPINEATHLEPEELMELNWNKRHNNGTMFRKL